LSNKNSLILYCQREEIETGESMKTAPRRFHPQENSREVISKGSVGEYINKEVANIVDGNESPRNGPEYSFSIERYLVLGKEACSFH